ncbi:MAG: tRNA(fMet)-specific endonuclease VapC [Acidobacteriota bacterium]|nr:tRNA(fMet)-specific endonuclease VapC [Acidobacteriota bacterium]
MSTAKESDIVVVDTDVISFIFKGDTRAALYEPHLDGRLQVIAAQTRAELERWALSHNWGWRRRAALYVYLKPFFFAGVDEAICLRWAEVQDNARRKGRPISCADTWIAATALSYDVPLVTHNPNDFKDVPGLIVITEL